MSKERYLPTHEWARMQEDRTIAVGLGKYAIDQLGDIVYMELPKAGRTVAKDEPFGIIESVKTTSDIYAPVGGKITAVNADVPDNPDILKTDTYGRGWLIKIAPSRPAEYDELMDAGTYQEFLEAGA